MNKSRKTESIVKEKNPAGEVRIMASPETVRGVYSNIALLQHTPNEFIVDFLLKLSGEPQLVSRVILSPQHALALLKALTINIKRYEDTFGKIPVKNIGTRLA